MFFSVIFLALVETILKSQAGAGRQNNLLATIFPLSSEIDGIFFNYLSPSITVLIKNTFQNNFIKILAQIIPTIRITA